MTYPSNYCAVDPGNSDVLPKTKPRRGAEDLIESARTAFDGGTKALAGYRAADNRTYIIEE